MSLGSRNRRFAAFDIDGTIIRWQLYHAIADSLAKDGILSADQYATVRIARMGWKNRTHETSFRDYENTHIHLIDDAIAGISVAELQTACEKVINEYKSQVYTFTRDLIKDLKQQDYLLFAISASQSQIVAMVAAYYGFDDYGGSEYEVKDGYFTGKKKLLVSEEKPKHLQRLAKKHNATWKESIAVGDSEGDIPMLSAVEQPIAFNPTKKLFTHAKDSNWRVVVERKNVIYQLEPKDGTFTLV